MQSFSEGPLSPESFEHFHFAHFRLQFEARARLLLPSLHQGNTLRGAFGKQLRRLSCLEENGCPGRCARPEWCVYGKVFEPAPPPDLGRLTANSDIPRPFVIRPPLTRQVEFATGSRLQFELLLFGSAVEYLPQFVLGFAAAGREGLGRDRVALELEKIDQVENRRVVQTILRSPSEELQMPRRLTCGADFLQRPCNSIQLRLLTPLTLKSRGRIVRPRELQFHHLLKRLRDRMNSLSCFYAGRALNLDFKQLGRQAEAVRCPRRRLRWESRRRSSGRTGQRHPMGGITGTVVFEGDLTAFWPLLCLGQWTHVGRFAVWGNGRYRLENTPRTSR